MKGGKGAALWRLVRQWPKLGDHTLHLTGKDAALALLYLMVFLLLGFLLGLSIGYLAWA